MGHVCTLRVRQWAAIRVGETEAVFGDASTDTAIPAGIRRRMGKLERLSVRCMLGLLASGTTDEIVFCSRYGSIEALNAMFTSIAAAEPVSPMAFSGSVHNSAPGLVAQIRKEQIPHTALAAGPRTLQAGLVEAYTRLAIEGSNDVVICFADLPLPEPYWAFEVEHQPGLALALRVALDGSPGSAHPVVKPGRQGAFELIEWLQQGRTALTVSGKNGDS